MTISTTGENPFSISFIVFNFVIFWVLKFSVLNVFFENGSLLFVYGTIVVSSLITSFIYILINIYETHKFEEIVMKMSMYVEEYDCSLFIGHRNLCILRLGEKECDVYINQLYFIYTQFNTNRAEYISKLKSQFVTLSKIDIVYIYISRYLKEFLTSVSLFVILQVCSELPKNTASDLVFMTIVLLLLILFCYTIIELCLIAINKYIKKRNLSFFISN